MFIEQLKGFQDFFVALKDDGSLVARESITGKRFDDIKDAMLSVNSTLQAEKTPKSIVSWYIFDHDLREIVAENWTWYARKLQEEESYIGEYAAAVRMGKVEYTKTGLPKCW